jgi:Bacterial TSP3 repeat/Excalibur calcium-binding domain
MNRVVVGLIALGLGAASVGRLAYAQDAGSPVITNADGSYVVSSDRGTTSTIDANGRDVVYGDITTGPGGVILGLPTPTPAPSDGGNGGGRNSDAPNLHPTADDTDGDNLSNELEAQFGTDPSNPDSDNDGVADGDEVNIYHTDPTKFDTDGDGHGDGEELFWLHTDPLVADAPDSQASGDQGTGDQGTGGETSGDQGSGGQQGDAQSSEQPVATCSDFASWYDAQNAYEAAGRTNADPALVQSLDPDGNGIACEGMME